MKEKIYGTREDGIKFKIDDNKDVRIIEMVEGVELKSSEIFLSRDMMYCILNSFVKTDFI